jgi:hypothetical protein
LAGSGGIKWLGLGKAFGRGAHSNDPSDPQYFRHRKVVDGSDTVPTLRALEGTYVPSGEARFVQPISLRVAEDVIFVDTPALDPISTYLKPVNWALQHYGVQPQALPIADLQ